MDNPSSDRMVLPNFVALREQCHERHWVDPRAMFDSQELDVITELFGEASHRFTTAHPGTDWRECTGLGIVMRDLEYSNVAIPKWATLAAWLAPESAASSAPELVYALAHLALNNRLHHRRPQR